MAGDGEAMEVDDGCPVGEEASACAAPRPAPRRQLHEAESLLLAARLLGSGERGSLQTLLLVPAGLAPDGAAGDVPLQLLWALQLLLSGVENAPQLLLTIQPLLTVKPLLAASAATAPRDCQLHCALRLVCLLLGESVHCRASALRPHLPPLRDASGAAATRAGPAATRAGSVGARRTCRSRPAWTGRPSVGSTLGISYSSIV